MLQTLLSSGVQGSPPGLGDQAQGAAQLPLVLGSESTYITYI